jgi:hypothetical protein
MDNRRSSQIFLGRDGERGRCSGIDEVNHKMIRGTFIYLVASVHEMTLRKVEILFNSGILPVFERLG